MTSLSTDTLDLTTLSYPSDARVDPLIGVVTNQPAGGSWAPRGRLEAFVPVTKRLLPRTLSSVNQSLGEFETYAAARDAILAWWASAGEFPRGLSPKIRYSSSKCSDHWEVSDTKSENLREWWENLRIGADGPKGPQDLPAPREAKSAKRSRRWGRRSNCLRVDPNRFLIPPDADGYWPPRDLIPQA